MYSYETTIYHAVLITAVVFGIIIIYFAVSVFRNQRRRIQLQRQSFLEQIVVLEKERQRIARDLHDELGPLLSVSKIRINAVNPILPEEKIHLKKAHDNLNSVINRMGDIAANLTPSALTSKGLKVIIEDYIDQFSHISNIRFQLIYEVNASLPDSLSIHIFRIIQEIVHNAVKHSQASTISIKFREVQKTLYIQCKDDGIGFNQELVGKDEKGLGLRSIKTRIELIGGRYNCMSAFPGGTEYFIQVPIKNNYGNTN